MMEVTAEVSAAEVSDAETSDQPPQQQGRSQERQLGHRGVRVVTRPAAQTSARPAGVEKMTDTESELDEVDPCLDKGRNEVPTFLDTDSDSEGPSAPQSLPVPSAQGNAPTQATVGQQRQRSRKRLRRTDGQQVQARSLSAARKRSDSPHAPVRAKSNKPRRNKRSRSSSPSCRPVVYDEPAQYETDTDAKTVTVT